MERLQKAFARAQEQNTNEGVTILADNSPETIE